MNNYSKKSRLNQVHLENGC